MIVAPTTNARRAATSARSLEAVLRAPFLQAMLGSMIVAILLTPAESYAP